MRTYIKDKIRNFIDLRVKLIRDEQRQNEQISFSFNQISQLFKEDNFIPFSTWSISPITILHVLNDITLRKRKNIIEFGSGASTFYIAKLLKVLNLDAVFFSVESNEKWANELQRQLKLYKLEDYVQIIYAPLVEVPHNLLFKEQKIWYNIDILQDKLKNVKHFDLVLVDGPVGGSTPYSRYSAIPFLKNKITKDCSVFLDDVTRSQEAKIAEEWNLQLNGNLKFRDRYAVFSDESNFEASPFQLSNLPFKLIN